MKRKLTITYSWKRTDGSDAPIPETHQEALEESAMERSFEQMQKGFTSGELNDQIHMDDNDPPDGIPYRGWWEKTKEGEIELA